MKQKQEIINFIINNVNLHNTKLSSFNNIVHIDKKFFYFKNLSKQMYLGQNKNIPTMKTNSKNMIKVMFLIYISKT